MSLFSDIIGAIGALVSTSPLPASGLIGDAIAAIPEIESAVAGALQKQGYTNLQIDAIFAQVLPWEKLGIDPKHPVLPEPAPAIQPPHTLAR